MLGDPAGGSGANQYRDGFRIGACGFSGFGEPGQFGDSQHTEGVNEFAPVFA